MKRLVLIMVLAASTAVPLLAQTITGPIELRNPHRVGDSLTSGLQVTPSPTPGVLAPGTTASAAMFAEGKYLFVLRGDSLFQFDKKTLKLLNSTKLPPTATPASTR